MLRPPSPAYAGQRSRLTRSFRFYQNLEGVQFVHIKRSNLYFVCTSKFNLAPAMTLELLQRIASIIKDYCGVLSEESIRVNFVLVYELLDEIIDYGYGQITATESLKAHIYKEPVIVQMPDRTPASRLGDGGPGTGHTPGRLSKRSVPSSAANKPVSLRISGERGNKNEVFLDLTERLTVLFSSSGSVVRSEINGSIQMKSFLQGSPGRRCGEGRGQGGKGRANPVVGLPKTTEISLGLNEDLIIGKERGCMCSKRRIMMKTPCS